MGEQPSEKHTCYDDDDDEHDDGYEDDGDDDKDDKDRDVHSVRCAIFSSRPKEPLVMSIQPACLI